MAAAGLLVAWMGWRRLRGCVRQKEYSELTIHVCVREGVKAGRGIVNDPFVLEKPSRFIDTEFKRDRVPSGD
jgi:hypothetical protein